jgi:hypothetical protein
MSVSRLFHKFVLIWSNVSYPHLDVLAWSWRAVKVWASCRGLLPRSFAMFRNVPPKYKL